MFYVVVQRYGHRQTPIGRTAILRISSTGVTVIDGDTWPALLFSAYCLVFCCTKTGFVPTLNLPHQNRLCIGTKPAFSFWLNISTVSEVRCDCQGLGLVARIEASIFVFDTIQVLYWPVLGLIQFCSFDRRCKTCLDTKPVLYQGRFCSLTHVT